MFVNTKLGDHYIAGICVIFNNLNCYAACYKHLSKLDDGHCKTCNTHLPEDKILSEFNLMIHIEGNTASDEMVSILAFKR